MYRETGSIQNSEPSGSDDLRDSLVIDFSSTVCSVCSLGGFLTRCMSCDSPVHQGRGCSSVSDTICNNCEEDQSYYSGFQIKEL